MIENIYNSIPVPFLRDTPQLATLLSVMFALFWVFSIFYVNYKLFDKTSEPGWAVFVPFYSYFIMVRISQKAPIIFWLFFYLSISYSWFLSLDGPLMALLSIICLVLLSIITINVFIGFIKQYNGGFIFWFCYLFLPIVAIFLVNKVRCASDVYNDKFRDLKWNPTYGKSPTDSPKE